MVSRFMQEPHESHWKVAKLILHYIQGTHSYGIHYASDVDIDLVGYTDSDWVSDSLDRKSTSKYCFYLGSGPISWSSKKQSAIALSSTEGEYRGAVNAAIEAIWLQNILPELNITFRKTTVLFCDNQSAIQISRNPVHHRHTKHIEIHMHYIRELIQSRSLTFSTVRHPIRLQTSSPNPSLRASSFIYVL
ncbi:secreted RxLR effector protein 161-like [Cryptomeria japonica]|uniref:secreted RxLR effector protein 161-like n=1 Tax=Cryptomeria japonica TaxID=3369 RepID=UPI0027DA13AE|nr:secreted RxLR effector protein 161-like [Cryptomeria japonica]